MCAPQRHDHCRRCGEHIAYCEETYCDNSWPAFPRYFVNRIGFAQSDDGRQPFLIRVNSAREGWLLLTDGTQRELTHEKHVEDWCHRMAEDDDQPLDELTRDEAERLIQQFRRHA